MLRLRRGLGHVAPWTAVALLCLAFVLNYVDRQVVFTIFPLLKRELGFSELQLGLAGSVFTWTYALLMPLSGRLADVLPPRRLVLGAIVLWSIATLGTAISRSAQQFLSWRVVMGVSESLYVPAAISIITSAHPGSTRSRALSVHGCAQFVGITLGGWYGGWSAEHCGWRWGFAVLAVIGFFYAGFLKTIDLDGQSGRVASEPSSWRGLLRSRSYVALCVAFLLFCSLLWMLYTWLPSYIYVRFHRTLAQSGLYATLYLQASSALGILLGGYLGDRLGTPNERGRLDLVALALFLCAPFAAGIYYASSLGALELCACVFGLLTGCVAANVFATLSDMVPRKDFGLATGLLNLAGGLGAGTAVFLDGLLRHWISNAALMLMSSAFEMIAALALFVVARSTLTQDHALVDDGSLLK